MPLIPFYERVRKRGARVALEGRDVQMLDAESLCVFKMMFFRLKDLADVEAMLRTQGAALDRAWVETNLLDIFGARDPRVTRWREIVADVVAETDAAG